MESRKGKEMIDKKHLSLTNSYRRENHFRLYKHLFVILRTKTYLNSVLPDIPIPYPSSHKHSRKKSIKEVMEKYCKHQGVRLPLNSLIILLFFISCGDYVQTQHTKLLRMCGASCIDTPSDVRFLSLANYESIQRRWNYCVRLCLWSSVASCLFPRQFQNNFFLRN